MLSPKASTTSSAPSRGNGGGASLQAAAHKRSAIARILINLCNISATCLGHFVTGCGIPLCPALSREGRGSFTSYCTLRNTAHNYFFHPQSSRRRKFQISLDCKV